MKTKKRLKNKKQDRKIKSKIILLTIAVLILIVFALVLIEKGAFKKQKIQEIHLNDDCSIIMQQKIHTINSETECESRCKTECGYEDLTYKNFNFVLDKTNCNSCDCYCI